MVVDEYVPDAQALQLRFEVAVPTELIEVPAAQVVHAVHEVALLVVEYVPLAQAVQA